MGSKYTVMEAIHVYNPHEATDEILKVHLDLIWQISWNCSWNYSTVPYVVNLNPQFVGHQEGTPHWILKTWFWIGDILELLHMGGPQFKWSWPLAWWVQLKSRRKGHQDTVIRLVKTLEMFSSDGKKKKRLGTWIGKGYLLRIVGSSTVKIVVVLLLLLLFPPLSCVCVWDR